VIHPGSHPDFYPVFVILLHRFKARFGVIFWMNFKPKILAFKSNWFHIIWSSIGYLKQFIFRTCPECTTNSTVLGFQFVQGENEVQMLLFKLEGKLDILRFPSI